MKSEALLTEAWNESYERRENYLFWPSDEAVKFMARYVRRRVGVDEFIDIAPAAAGSRMVDIGCGVGRHLMFGTDMGLEMYGNDLSAHAVDLAQKWLATKIGTVARQRVAACDIRNLPWEKNFFDHAMSDSVLDSMPFEVAQEGMGEIARIVRPGGYFYCSLISGDETGQEPDFCGEVVVEGKHEQNTIQSYFSYIKVKRLLEPLFEILDCSLIQMRNQLKGTHHGRWHVVSRRRQL